jgi:hypothetical protein
MDEHGNMDNLVKVLSSENAPTPLLNNFEFEISAKDREGLCYWM